MLLYILFRMLPFSLSKCLRLIHSINPMIRPLNHICLTLLKASEFLVYPQWYQGTPITVSLFHFNIATSSVWLWLMTATLWIRFLSPLRAECPG